MESSTPDKPQDEELLALEADLAVDAEQPASTSDVEQGLGALSVTQASTEPERFGPSRPIVLRSRSSKWRDFGPMTLEDKLATINNSLLPAGETNVASYLQAISKVPLLEADEEVTLAMRIEAGLYAGACLTSAAQTEVPLESQTVQDLQVIQTEGHKAKDLLFQANLRLCVAMAKRYSGLVHMKLLDVVQEGNLGLMRAVEKFDYTKGYKFSTYAAWWIRQAITASITEAEPAIRITDDFDRHMQKVGKAQQALSEKLGRQPTIKELSQETGEPIEKVKLVRQTQRAQPISFGTPIPETDKTLEDYLADQKNTAFIDSFAHREDQAQISYLLSRLEPRLATVLCFTYGLGGREPLLQRQIGKLLGLSTSRIGQLQATAIEKFRGIARQADFNYFT